MAAGDLTSLSAVKDLLTVKGSEDDALLQYLITGLSAFLKKYLNNDLISASYSERYNGTGSKVLCLKNSPITAVSSLKVDGVPVAESTGFLTGYIIGEHYLLMVGSVFTKGQLNVEVSYTAGLAAVPEDISLVCKQLVGAEYKVRARLGEKSRSIPTGGTVSFAESDLTPLQAKILSNYKKVCPI